MRRVADVVGVGELRVPLVRSAAEQADDEAFLRLYGPWAPWTPAEASVELSGFDRPWWVVGGWAVEAATGFQREHEDLDVSILARDVPAFVEHLRGRWHVWSNAGGVLRPLGERWTDVEDPATQLWVRASATDPWVLDVPLTPDIGGRWTHKFLPGEEAEVDEVTWVGDDGIRYLAPEIVLSYKARLRRLKDDPDFDACRPVLTGSRRSWLRGAIERSAPGHPWSARL